MVSFEMILAAIVLTSACSVDCLVAGLAYGSDKIKIPFVSGLIINLICSGILAISLFLGGLIGDYIPQEITLIIACSILIFMGLHKLISSVLKAVFKKKEHSPKEIKFSLFGFQFTLKICRPPQDYDTDKNKILSPKEAAFLAVALSIDGLAAGISAGLAFSGFAFYLTIIIISFIPDFLFLYAGHFVGNKIARKIPINLSFVSGLLLILLALLKIFVI
ncbi:MAG: sporulation membrane protein YtaF [Firmicutes bacterium]|nr:sporulation membrane protein YtaF [Bacillota bacterium]